MDVGKSLQTLGLVFRSGVEKKKERELEKKEMLSEESLLCIYFYIQHFALNLTCL